MDDILTIHEVAELFKVSRSTVWRWCSTGVIPAFKIGHNWRIRRTALEEKVGQSFQNGEFVKPNEV